MFTLLFLAIYVVVMGYLALKALAALLSFNVIGFIFWFIAASVASWIFSLFDTSGYPHDE